jgi:spermidine synthase
MSGAERLLPLLLGLLVASGCAALIYEVVWFQLIELVIGSSTISLGILLATYMGGLCLGSLALPRLISAARSPLLVYGALELGTGASAIALLFALPWVGAAYAAHAEHGLASLALRGGVCAVLLLPATILMGATLPAIARSVESSPKGIAWLGRFYAGNLAGAVAGCLLAGFYLLRVHDMGIATYVGAAINTALAAIAFALSGARSRGRQPLPLLSAETPAQRTASATAVHIVIGLSGAAALGSEVVWNRLLALLLGPSVYAFSIILAVFLLGLGVGSSAGAVLARRSARPRLALGMAQLVLVAALGWAATMIDGSLPFWPISPALSASPWVSFQLDLVRVAWAIFPAACAWGASFPLALAAAAAPGEDAGRLTGAVYAANTVGAIAGALAFSTILIPAVGTYESQRLLIAICLVSGLLMLMTLMPDQTGKAAAPEPPLSRLGIIGALGAVLATAALLWAIPGRPDALIAFGRDLPQWHPPPQLLFVGEGINSSVAVTQFDDGNRSFHVSGRPEASSGAHDMRTQRMIGHVAALLHPRPRSVLVVGFGAGVTAGSFVTYPEVERIVICELEPLIPEMVSTFFATENHEVLKDPRVELVFDDARHYLLTTRERFDIITSDPIHPWIKGSAALYTEQYFELAREHLNPGGVVTQWVPFYESTVEAVKSEFATFFRVFPQGLVFTNDSEDPWASDSILFGAADPKPIEVDKIEERLRRPDYGRVKQSLRDVDFFFATDLLATYTGRAADLGDWLAQAQINTDRNLRLQYLAGMGSIAQQAAPIYEDLLRQRRFPEGLFIAAGETRMLLRQALGAADPGK